MRRALAICMAMGSLLCAAPAMAQSTLGFSATFHDPVGGPVSSPFSCPASMLCGSGEVIGLGQATQTTTFYDVCGNGCAIQTITFADGSTLVTQEVLAGCSTPGVGYDAEPPFAYGHPFSCTFNAPVEGSLSTGTFAGASGALTGELNAAGGLEAVQESGAITLT